MTLLLLFIQSVFSFKIGWGRGIRTPDHGVKVRCLTAWPYPSIFIFFPSCLKADLLYKICQKVKINFDFYIIYLESWKLLFLYFDHYHIMMWLINFLKKRPSDHSIHIYKIALWILIIGWLYYNLIYQWDSVESTFFWFTVSDSQLLYIKYSFLALWLFPLFFGILNVCLIKKKYIRIGQIFFGILLFYVSSKIIPSDPNRLDVDTLIAFLWFFPLISWITWKCITTKCMKFWEKITKIRV